MIYIENENSTISLPVEVKACETFIERLLGALPAGGIDVNSGYLLPGCRWIHTLFMRRPIDIIFFDDSGRVIKYYPEVKPFRVLKPQKNASGALELAPGRIGPGRLTYNSRLIFET